MRPFYNFILRSPDPDTDNGGGGGDPKPDTGGFSDAQLKAIGGVVNQAVTSHLKRLPNLADQLKDFKWEDVLTPIVTKLVPSDSGEPKPKGGKGTPADPSDYAAQLQKLAADLEAQKKATLDAEQRRTQAETARRVDGAKLKLRSALQGKVMDGALDHAINHLTLVQNRLNVDEDGNVTIKVKRPEYPGAPPTELELGLEDAIKDILEEGDMKVFLPPPQGKGTTSGPRLGPGGRPISFEGEAKTPEEKLARAAAREAELLAKFGNR